LNTTCSFSWFFHFVFFLVVGGERWEDYRKMSSLETILHFCSSGGTLRFVQPPSLSSYVFLSWADRDVIVTIRFLLKTEVEVFLCLSSFSLGGLKVLNLSPWSLDLWMQA
jgi:hypothetical protein